MARAWLIEDFRGDLAVRRRTPDAIVFQRLHQRGLGVAAILTFSAGAIALSLTFVEKIAPRPVRPSLLYVSWIAFGVAVLCVVISFVFSQKAIQKEIDYVDSAWEAVRGRQTELPQRVTNNFASVTRHTNTAAGGMFTVGLTFLVLFGIANWPLTGNGNRYKIDSTSFTIEVGGSNMPEIKTTTPSVVVPSAPASSRGNVVVSPLIQPAPQPPAQPTTTTTNPSTSK